MGEGRVTGTSGITVQRGVNPEWSTPHPHADGDNYSGDHVHRLRNGLEPRRLTWRVCKASFRERARRVGAGGGMATVPHGCAQWGRGRCWGLAPEWVGVPKATQCGRSSPGGWPPRPPRPLRWAQDSRPGGRSSLPGRGKPTGDPGPELGARGPARQPGRGWPVRPSPPPRSGGRPWPVGTFRVAHTGLKNSFWDISRLRYTA